MNNIDILSISSFTNKWLHVSWVILPLVSSSGFLPPLEAAPEKWLRLTFAKDQFNEFNLIKSLILTLYTLFYIKRSIQPK